MLGLPKSTEFNKRIPKQKFYDNLTISPSLKRYFVEQVKGIYWKNKIAVSTMNLAAGNHVTEIEVFEVELNSQEIDDNFLKQIDKEIPYHILFLLKYEKKYQVWIGYKEEILGGGNAFKVNCYYHTDWFEEDNIPLQADGLNVDDVYENYVRQIAGVRFNANSTESLKESVEKDEKKQQLQKKIESLQAKIRKEKQLNVQMKLNMELKKVKKELEEL